MPYLIRAYLNNPSHQHVGPCCGSGWSPTSPITLDTFGTKIAENNSPNKLPKAGHSSHVQTMW